MKLISPAFENGGKIPRKYTCDGDNVNPRLIISGTPKKTKSFALIMYDPDIPEIFKKQRGIEGWDHWVIWNILPDTKEIKEGARNFGVEGKQTGGKIGYTGPCPPKEYEPTEHRYYFWVYALDIEELDLEEGATKAELEDAMQGHIIEKAELMGTYSRI